MAQYRLSVYVAKRSDNRNGIAMAAYRAAEKLPDHKTGETIDFSRRQGVLYSEIIAPDNAPEWATDRAALWNRSEAAHKRKDAVIAREIQLSLPHELTDQQRQELTTSFARFISDSYGVAVDMNLHAPNKQGDSRNYHAHLLVCTRSFDAAKEHGLGNNVRAFDAVSHQKANTENHVEIWRAKWEQQVNDALERADIREADGVTIKSVNHQSHARRGLDDEPTIKEGTAATAKKRRGEHTDRADQNDEIRQRNEENARLAEEIRVEAQELDLLRRRQAELMAAHDLRETITPTKDPTETMAPRTAKDLTAPIFGRELTADNDNAQPGEPTPIKRLKGESDQNYQARSERIREREKETAQRADEAPRHEMHLRPKGRGFRY